MSTDIFPITIRTFSERIYHEQKQLRRENEISQRC